MIGNDLPARNEAVRFHIALTSGEGIMGALSAPAFSYEDEAVRVSFYQQYREGCALGLLRIQLRNESWMQERRLRAEAPVEIYLPAGAPIRMTALYLYNSWWTRPAFVEAFERIPEKTQILLMQYGSFVRCIIPMVGDSFKSMLSPGTDRELKITVTACIGGQTELEHPLFIAADAETAFQAVQKAICQLAGERRIKPRQSRVFPEIFRYLGWCSWDAFYRDISADKLLEKMRELNEKTVPVRWFLFDDGWLDTDGDKLNSFAPDVSKFPEGFAPLIKTIRQHSGIRWFGVWHALCGYWGGIRKGSVLENQERGFLTETTSGKVLPNPNCATGFYNDWYRYLRAEGIDFVKVDGQSSLPNYYGGKYPLPVAAGGIHIAVENAAAFLNGAVINCMGMAMENIAARPSSAISRNSDDFLPGKENSFSEHLMQNAFNALYHNEFYVCDWDMFWTNHPDAVRHGILRAISGGPVYVSDPLGETKPEMLQPLIYTDGEILRMERSAFVTEDCVFTNPQENGVLKLENSIFSENRSAGCIAVFNLTGAQQSYTVCPRDIRGLKQAEAYWIYDYFARTAQRVSASDGVVTGALAPNGFAYYFVFPALQEVTCIGLADKYAGFISVEACGASGNTYSYLLHEAGSIAWMSEAAPQKVEINGRNASMQVQRNGNVFLLPLEKCPEKVFLSIHL